MNDWDYEHDKRIVIYLPPDKLHLYEKFKEEAERRDRSMAYLGRTMIEQFLEREPENEEE